MKKACDRRIQVRSEPGSSLSRSERRCRREVKTRAARTAGVEQPNGEERRVARQVRRSKIFVRVDASHTRKAERRWTPMQQVFAGSLRTPKPCEQSSNCKRVLDFNAKFVQSDRIVAFRASEACKLCIHHEVPVLISILRMAMARIL